MAATKNVVELLTDQHRHIEKLFEEVDTTTEGGARTRAFEELRRMLSVHEAAEEIITHPSATRHGNGDIVEARQAEEHEAKKLLADLDGTDTTSPEFQIKFGALRSKVLAHAGSEEELEFPALVAEASTHELEKMASAVKAVEKVAPTHPHPGAGESAAVNASVGPLVGLLDKVRDAATSAMH